jgi:hypothetical protein
MIVLAVVGGIILALLAVAGWYDYRARARGTRFRLTGREAYQNRVDAQMRADPILGGSPQDWTPPGKREPRP